MTINQLTMINLAPRDREGGDCFVRALAFILRKTAHYTDIEELVMREQPDYDARKKTGGGVASYKFLKHERKLFGRVFRYFHVPMGDRSMRVWQFIEQHSKGTFLICADAHAFVIENGEIFDACRPRLRSFIREAWVVGNA